MFKVLPSSLHQKLWQQRVSNDNNQVWVLKNPQLEGLLMLEKQADEIELAALYLLPKTIGKGWGRAMLKHACQQANVKQLHCWVMQDNEHAEGFYRHLGFTFDGELRKVAFSGSDFMQKKAHLATDSRFF
ncbi:hypothetical protein AHAT_40210 [Agarivorans sp. Toyoura001]|uniref:GNAT family N-acetyltransferase n=1 Tax=Agarivorans sp. Toyoura001 TaxID=2283141 RepID=UPI0010ED1BB3|nr:GNAT family N-acetyltransferase [Agarivorans sp. Toyoura001]GDY28131.1 hypothetical protein AHAT_40210 [Agarivorans sp. Toyoura001]